MPNPTPGDVHVNALLTNVSIAYLQTADGFVADKVFPNVPVQKQSDLYLQYDRADFWRNDMQKRAPATESAGGGYRMTQASYFAHVWALHKDIDDQTRANADSMFDLQRDAANYLSQQAMIRREKEWVTSYFKTGVWGLDLTGVPGAPGANQFKQWDQSGSTPIKDLRTQITAQSRATGYRPNTLVLGAEGWAILQDHPDFLDRIKYTQQGIVTEAILSGVLGLDRVLVASGVEATSAEGATDAFAFLAGKNALLTYTPPNPGLMQPAAGYTFSWVGYLGAGPAGQRVSNFRMDPIRSERIELEMAFDIKMVANVLGTFYSGVIA